MSGARRRLWAKKQAVLADLGRGRVAADVAAKYDLSIRTVQLWAKSAGLARTERRGRKKRRKLSDRDYRSIVAKKGRATQESVAQEYGISRSYVARLWNGTARA